MIRIGIVGIGFMGRIHYLASQQLRGAKVTAICSRDEKKLAGDWTNTRGNFGPEPTHFDLSAIKKYQNYDEMLRDPEIDLIDICNTTKHHPEFAIQALRAGKHVLVEKAIALTIADADAMVAEVKKAGKMLMVAHVLPFFSEFRYAAKLVEMRSYGRLLGAHFTRVIAQPDWSAEIGDALATGGPAVDLHIHDTHFIALIAGVPRSVSSVGSVHQGVVNYLTTTYDFGRDGPAITCSSGAVAMSSRPFMHGFEIYLEKATLAFNSNGTPLTLYLDGSSEKIPCIEDVISCFNLEIQTAVDSIRSGTLSPLLSGELARNALMMCHKEIESVMTGRVVPLI